VVCFRHPELVAYFLGQELVARIATDTFHRNSRWYKPFILYLPALTIGAGFWCFYLIKTIKNKKLFRLKTVWAYFRAGKTGAFLIIWISIPLFVFFVAQSRLFLYVLPLYAPVALIIGRGIEGQISRRKVLFIAIITAMILIGFKGLAERFPRKNDMKALFSICNRIGGKDVQVISYLESKLFGLQFYLDGHLVRLANQKTPWSDDLVDHFIEAKLKKHSANRYIIVTRLRYGDFLRKILVAKNIGFEEYHNAFWQLFYMRPVESS
jgi:4-amino-4-deoxy-L-arabinose transferase